MENNAKVYKVLVDKDGKKYVNYYLEINGFNVCIQPKFLKDGQYKAFFYLVPKKEVK